MIQYIAQSFKEFHAADGVLTTDLPGGLHYGLRTDTRTPRPFGLFTVVQISRVPDSGGGALVTYTLVLKVYGKQRFRPVESILRDFATRFGTFGYLVTVPLYVAEVLSMTVAGESSVSEDPKEEYGKDCIVGEIAWTILLNEALQLYGAPT